MQAFKKKQKKTCGCNNTQKGFSLGKKAVVPADAAQTYLRTSVQHTSLKMLKDPIFQDLLEMRSHKNKNECSL